MKSLIQSVKEEFKLVKSASVRNRDGKMYLTVKFFEIEFNNGEGYQTLTRITIWLRQTGGYKNAYMTSGGSCSGGTFRLNAKYHPYD